MYDAPIIRQALRVSAEAHLGQHRKGGTLPYIIHPVGVMLVAAEHTQDAATLAAALLHDVLEDASDKYSESEMRRDFGDVITDIVKAVSKDESIADWRERNEAYLANLRASGNERAYIVCAADKVNNLTSMLDDHAAVGDGLWDRFNAGQAEQLWWYQANLDQLSELMPGHPLVERLRELVARLKGLAH